LFWRWVGKATRPVIGWVLLGIAALVILIGWIGVSGTPVVASTGRANRAAQMQQ